jgi:hypothetical protein
MLGSSCNLEEKDTGCFQACPIARYRPIERARASVVGERAHNLRFRSRIIYGAKLQPRELIMLSALRNPIDL